MKKENLNENKVLEMEKQVLMEEKKLMNEIKEEETAIKKLTKNIWVTSSLLLVIIFSIVAGITYWKISSTRIYTDDALVSATVTNISPSHGGILNDIFVNVGDIVPANTLVAQVGNELLKTKTESIIIDVKNTIGKSVSPGENVVSVINPEDLRVVAHVDEDKGLSDIHIGEQADFTIDAFGSKRFHGIVDEISPTARQGDIVFSISDKRPTNQFDVKIRFDNDQYPEISNGMSAKVWIYR